jgi:signal transduction histidine kinase
VRRRSVTNPGGTAGSVNGGQADGGGSGLLTGASGDASAAPRSDVAGTQPTGPNSAVIPASASASTSGTTGSPTAASFGPSGTAAQVGSPRAAVPGSRRARFALANWRVRWRLTAVIAVPTLIAAFLGAFTIYGNVNTWTANGRVENLAHVNASVVKLTQALEDERDLSAGYAADRAGGTALLRLKQAQNATSADATTVISEAAGVTTGAGYQPTTVQDLSTLTDALKDLPAIRQAVTTSLFPASQVIRVYTDNIIAAANAFSVATSSGTGDADLQGNITVLGALLRVENEMSVQRAVLYAALSSPSATFGPGDLATLNQASESQTAEQSDFTAAASESEAEYYNNTVSGPGVDLAAAEETLAEQVGSATPNSPLTSHGLTANGWYTNQKAAIDDVRTVAGGLVSAITDRASNLRSQATRNLLINSLVAVVLLLLVLLISTIVARSLIRPLRKLRSDALDVAGHRLPEMVRRLSQSEGTDESVDIEPIGVTSTDEIGEVARAFDQVHREAVRLAADEAMLRGNLNAMFINLSRRSQSLIERQLSLIDSLEQSEQDPGRLSSLFRLDHLATRMRRNSENLLVLAGHEVTRRWSQPVPLVDVLRAAISEIEQYERVVLNVQPGIVVVGQAVNDVVHLVAEIVENATTFSPEDTQVYVSGQPLSSGGVLLDITDNGVGISDQEMSHANWRLDNPPVVDVAVSRRMGLFVVGRLAARHGVRVRLRHAQASGLTALIWLPDTVAAPEVAPPLGRLRRFEADDYGSVPSLTAPTQATQGAAATAAARIPRFSPTSPSSPSFTPAAGLGAQESSAPAGPGAARNGAAASPAAGGGDTTPALPVRTANGKGEAGQASPTSPTAQASPVGGQAGEGGDVTIPRAPAAPAGGQKAPGSPAGSGPTRLPAFGGPASQAPKIAGQNVHGGDGPSAAGLPAAPRGGQSADSADLGGSRDTRADPARVTVPPPAAANQRLPIFDSLESDWFRRSGKTVGAARTQGTQGLQGAQASAAGGGPPTAQSSWTSPADEGWRAAQALAAPTAGDTTQAGLPRRVPRANLVPGSVGAGDAEAEVPARSPDAARTRMASFQRGVREGRAAAPQIEEP